MDSTITVIIPCYPTFDFLFRSLNSLSNQSFENFDVVIVLDGIEDTEEKEKELKEKFSNIPINIIKHERNRSTLQARLTGTRYIKGKYTYFMDADDEISSHVFKNCINCIERTDADIVGFHMSDKRDKIKGTICDEDILHYMHYKIKIGWCNLVNYFFKSDIVKKGVESLNLHESVSLSYSEDLLMLVSFMYHSQKIVEDYKIGTYFYKKDNPSSTVTTIRNDKSKTKKHNELDKFRRLLTNNFLNKYHINRDDIGFKVNQLGQYQLRHKNKIIR